MLCPSLPSRYIFGPCLHLDFHFAVCLLDHPSTPKKRQFLTSWNAAALIKHTNILTMFTQAGTTEPLSMHAGTVISCVRRNERCFAVDRIEREFLYAYEHFLSPPLSTLLLIQPTYETESLLLREKNEEIFGNRKSLTHINLCGQEEHQRCTVFPCSPVLILFKRE